MFISSTYHGAKYTHPRIHSHQSTSVKDETKDNVVGGFAGGGGGDGR